MSATTILFPSAAATDAGGAPYQQDRACINRETRTIGVFDGHGDYGDLAAQVAADTVAAAPVATPFADLFAAADSAILDAMRARITAEGKPIMEEGGALYRPSSWGARGPQYRGGTTASVLRIAADGALSAANVGDSDIVIFDGPADAGRTLIADHTPTCLAEWERVHAAHPATRFRFNNPHDPYGWKPERPVWTPVAAGGWELNPRGGYLYTDVRNTWGAYVTVHDGSESLAMTRALGDFHIRRHGVIATPESQEVPPPAPGTTRAVILGSDGLWDTLQFEEARDLVYRAEYQGQPDAATAALLALGLEKAHAKFGPVVDNVICAVVYITVAPAAAPADEEEEESAAPAPEDADPMTLACALHGPMVRNPGGLWYSMNEDGRYGMYAPPCNGCPRGADEQGRVYARFSLMDATGAARLDPSEANKERLRVAIANAEPWADYLDYYIEAARALLEPAAAPPPRPVDAARASFRAAIAAVRADPSDANKERLRAALELYGDMAIYADILVAESLLAE